MSFTKEQLAYQAVWRKALASGTVEITFKSLADARRVRFGLYNALRPFKEGRATDPALLSAAEECSIQLEGTTLRVIRKLDTAVMQSVLEAVGMTAEEVSATPALDMPAEAQESLSKVLGLLKDNPVPTSGAGGDRARLDYASLLKDLRGEG